MQPEIKPYYILENYLDKEFCKYLEEYFLDRVEEDPREFYGTFGLGSKEEFFNIPDPKPREFDPAMELYDAIRFGHTFFLKTYPTVGEFELNRSHVNFMFPGAELSPHKDDRNYDEPIESLASRTHVMGIFLTDDYEGGELTFPDYNIAIKPSVGSLVFFPGYYSKHGVNKVTSGVRINILSHYFDIIDRDGINPNYTKY